MIYYEKIGKGSPVFLIHGFPNDHTSWDPIIQDLQEKYTLYLPDLPGAGQSDFLHMDLTMEDIALEINEIFLKEKIDKAILAGHSMGGYSAFNFAHLFPEKVQGLSSIHSSAQADNLEKKENRAKVINLIQKGEMQKSAFLKGMAYRLFSESFRQENPTAPSTIVKKGEELSIESLSALYSAIKNREDRTDVLRKADFPIQWIIGNEDSSSPMEETLEQCYMAPINSVSIYEPCGHLSMLEHPKLLTNDLLAFFDFAFRC